MRVSNIRSERGGWLRQNDLQLNKLWHCIIFLHFSPDHVENYSVVEKLAKNLNSLAFQMLELHCQPNGGGGLP